MIEGEELTATQWSNWDDTYEFIENQNDEYENSVLVDETFIHGELNIVLYVNQSGEIVFGKAFDHEQKKETRISPELLEDLESNQIIKSPNSDFEGNTGLVLLEDQILLLSVSPVLTSTGTGPSRGFLVRGKILDQTEISEKIGVSSDALDISSETIESDKKIPVEGYNNRYLLLQSESDSSEDEEKICAILVLENFYGDPISVTITTEREIYAKGLELIEIFLLTILVQGCLFAAGFLILFNRKISVPLENMAKQANEIAEKGDLTSRITLSSDSEFRDLGSSVNTMLESLEVTTQNELKSKLNYRNLFRSSLDGIIRTDSVGTIVDANPSFLRLIGISSVEELTKYSIRDLFDSESLCTIPIPYDSKNGYYSGKEVNLISPGENTKPVPVSVSSWPRMNEAGVIGGIWWLIRDLREKKEREQLQKETLIQIQKNMEQMTFLNDEIRNPLTVISGLVSMDSPDAKDEILQQISRINQIICKLDEKTLDSIKIHQFITKYYGTVDQSSNDEDKQ